MVSLFIKDFYNIFSNWQIYGCIFLGRIRFSINNISELAKLTQYKFETILDLAIWKDISNFAWVVWCNVMDIIDAAFHNQPENKQACIFP